MSDILEEYKTLSEQAKNLEKRREGLKKQIFALMDEKQSDSLSFGDYKAARQLVVQERVDSAKVRELLGESISKVLSEIEIIKLQVL